MDERIWMLPGPRSLIRDVVQECARHRHVAVVLPSELAKDPRVTDSLAVELMTRLERVAEPRRVHADPDSETLLGAVGTAVVYDGIAPATVPDLLWHRDALTTAAVVVAADMPDAQQREFPAFLARLERETRSASLNAKRLNVITICGRTHLPQFAGGESTDVTLATVWWWNRIARWDVSAHISHLEPPLTDSRVLSDVLMETIVEIARWDLDLAETMAEVWSGDPQDIAKFFDARFTRVESIADTGHCGSSPSDSVMDLWDGQVVDGWHDCCSTSAHALLATPDRLDRLVWAAQARILLPWIEERRELLYQRVKQLLGRKRFQAALSDLFDPPLTDTGVIEIGPLRRIVDVRIGSSNATVRSAARRLHDARNRLAHLEPLGLAQLRELVAIGATLG